MAYSKEQTKNYITKYINFYADTQIAMRGKRMYNDGLVEYSGYDEKKDTYKFLVEGSDIYTVNIKGISKNDVSAGCTCPYDWGGMCKHTVASLLYIKERIGNAGNLKSKSNQPVPKPKNTLRLNPGNKLEIPFYENITKEHVYNYLHFNTKNSLRYSYGNEIRHVDIKGSKIIFEIKVSWDIEKVTIEKIGDKVYISSTDSGRTANLSKAEAICLLSLAKSNHSDIIDFLFSGRVTEKNKEVLRDYGLPESTDFYEYFHIGYSAKDGLVIYKNKKAYGLIPVVDKLESPVLDFIKSKTVENKIIKQLKKKKEERKLAFVLHPDMRKADGYYDDYYDYDDEFIPSSEERPDYSIVPIIGKPNKQGTKLNSHIETYSQDDESNFNVVKSDSASELLKTIELLDDEEELETRFRLMKKAFKLLLKESVVLGVKKGSYSIKKKNLEEIKLSENPISILFEATQNKEFIKLDMKALIGDELIKPSKLPARYMDDKIAFHNGTYYFIDKYSTAEYLLQFPDELKMPKTHKEEFYRKVVEPISRNFNIEFKTGSYNVNSVELDFSAKQVYLTEQDEYLIISPQVEYQNGVSVLLSNSGNILNKQNGSITEFKRNFELENDFVELIAGLHPNFDEQKNKRIFYLHYSEFMKNMWFYKFFDHLQSNNVQVFGLKELKNFKYSPYKGKVNTSISSGEDWFEVNVELSFGDNTVSLKDIRKAIINKQKYIQLKDGSVGILPDEWMHKLEKYFRNGEIKKDKLEISKLRFSVIDELFDNIDDDKILEDIIEKKKRLATFTEISKTKVPAAVKAELRQYQKEGLNWLNFLHDMKWGGILADDMGLGKTLQILTFLQHINSKKKSTSLIVVPTTLLFNWENEIEKFTPKLKAFYHYGTNRSDNTNDFSKYHMVFTTYGVLLRDIELLKEFEFNYVILDESQAIKNPASRRYKAANLLNAKNRIAMSGTPIENSTFDLFAQMSFVNPGFFGGANNFKENYSNPIDKDGEELVASELQKLINPFVLRRTKERVASELPAKTEDIIYCEMEPEQRKVYDAYRNDYKERLLNKIEDDGMGKSKMMVLEALTRLRQICDSPALLKSEDITENQSIKIKEIVRNITQRTAKHKILIFSQFVGMLSLLKDELNKLNVEYEYLDGQSSTAQREQSVNNFQNNDDLRVFLISLKAGGTGLNLTAADYVYLLDPWWNPAVENQAIDRCYRIGQDKKVFAYRMICKNTVEEKILKLQNKKKKIAGDIISTDENIMKALDVKDIQELFS